MSGHIYVALSTLFWFCYGFSGPNQHVIKEKGVEKGYRQWLPIPK